MAMQTAGKKKKLTVVQKKVMAGIPLNKFKSKEQYVAEKSAAKIKAAKMAKYSEELDNEFEEEEAGEIEEVAQKVPEKVAKETPEEEVRKKKVAPKKKKPKKVSKKSKK